MARQLLIQRQQPLAGNSKPRHGEIIMKDMLLNLSAKIQTLMQREEGQDLIEYALVVALIAFAATAGMKTLATDINVAFTSIGTTLTTYTG